VWQTPIEEDVMSTGTGAQSVIEALQREGVEVVFGVPGGAILPIYDAVLQSPIRHVLARHEQGAGHMAEGYAQVTGRPGVIFATSGPGATNLVTPLMNALLDSTPLVAITGQVATISIGTDAFQEAPTTAITRHCTKRNWLVTDAADIAGVVAEAFDVATTGRPGPVLIDVPKDVQAADAIWSEATIRVASPSISDHGSIDAAIHLIERASRPALYVGGGILRSRASDELLRFAELTNIPVVTTLMGRGAFPDLHSLALGMPGMHGNYTAITALQRSDLIVAIGVRFDDRVTGDPSTFAPHADVVHIDVDPNEIGKIRVPQVGIVGDAGEVLGGLVEAWGDRPAPPRAPWMETLQGWQRDKPIVYEQSSDGPIKPQFVIDELWRLTDGDAVLVAGVGQHQMWASQLWRFRRPHTWVNSGGLGTMGFAIPAAIGAKVAAPDELVYAIDGDGCFQMTFQELITAADEGIAIKVAVINNHHYGLVKQWQDLFYEGRYSAVQLGNKWPDYPALAASLGCVGLRATTPAEVPVVIEESLAIVDRPVVIEFVVDDEEALWPMVVAGGNNDEVHLGPETVIGDAAHRPRII
jgi:acetolactate synthase-1/2/3 large subunit